MNNDLIRRGDVLRELDSFLAEVAEKMLSILEQYGACANRAVTNCEKLVTGGVDNIRKRINAIPAVEQPMSALEYERARARRVKWCSVRPCYKCEYFDDCNRAHEETLEDKVARVERWAQEHPDMRERSEKE